MASNTLSTCLPSAQIYPSTGFLSRVKRGIGNASVIRAVVVDRNTSVKEITGFSSLILRKTLTKPAVLETVGRGIGTEKFGRFGGKYVPEILIACLNEIEAEFNLVLRDAEFQVSIKVSLKLSASSSQWINTRLVNLIESHS